MDMNGMIEELNRSGWVVEGYFRYGQWSSPMFDDAQVLEAHLVWTTDLAICLPRVTYFVRDWAFETFGEPSVERITVKGPGFDSDGKLLEGGPKTKIKLRNHDSYLKNRRSLYDRQMNGARNHPDYQALEAWLRGFEGATIAPGGLEVHLGQIFAPGETRDATEVKIRFTDGRVLTVKTAFSADNLHLGDGEKDERFNTRRLDHTLVQD